MKVLQLNIWGGALMKNVLEVIEREDPDVLCMQEVFSTERGETFLYLENLEAFKEKFPDYYVFYSPTWSNKTEGVKVRFGNAIFSKFPITHQETVFTANAYMDELECSTDDPNIRNFQHAVIDNPEGLINIINHHGYWMTHKNGNDETMRQMKMISDYISKLSGAIVLTGDFNLAPDSPSLDGLNELLENLCITHDIKNTRNQFAKRSPEVCDYIFVDKNAEVKHFTVLDDLISDHAALVATF